DSYKNNILVDPGVTTTKVVNLSYKAITVSWDVKETEVEDEYNIVTTLQYETNVPAPVIEVVEPDRLDLEQMGVGESQIYNAILTNKGLITALHACYTTPERTGSFRWQPLVENKDLTLAPQQSYVIPVKITRMGASTTTNPVNDITNSETEWFWDFTPGTTEPTVSVKEPESLDLGSLGIGESLDYEVTLTNNGSVPVYDLTYSLPAITGDYKWEPQQPSDGISLAPGESRTVPVKVTKVDPDEAARLGGGSAGSGSGSAGTGSGSSHGTGKSYPCVAPTNTDWQWECGPDKKYGWYPHPIQLKNCSQQAVGGGGWYTVYGGGLGSPNGGGGGSYSSSTNTGHVSISTDCDPCTTEYLKKWAECGISFVPKLGCVYGSYACNRDAKPDAGWRFYTTCTITALGCATEFCTDASVIALPATLGGSIVPAIACGAVGKGLNVVNCLIALTEPCGDHPWWGSFTPFSWKAPGAPRRAAAAEPNWLTNYRLTAEIPAQEHWAFNAMQLEIFGDSVWLSETTEEEVYAVLKEAVRQEGTITVESLRGVKPQGISEAQLARFVERLNNSTAYDEAGTDAENRIHKERFAGYAELIEAAEEASRQMGYQNTDEMWIAESDKFKQQADGGSGSVCATVSLQISQTMTMTRQAFRGTLTVYNGNQTQAMENVKLSLNVTNRLTQQVATSHEFEMHTESLMGFTGDLPMDAGWHLGTDSTGTATILFIPTKYAAPDVPIEYSFGGTLSYVDPYTGLEVTRELYPVTLTVKPSPELDLTYFMQRDIYGDDPLTEAVEPMTPAEFAVIVNNKGNGDATNVRMVTNQPEIVENEKGLLIDFEFLSSQLNGEEKTLAMGGSIPTDFGTIGAHSQAYAQWWLQSTLLGHFVKYNIEATHVTSYGNEDLSLLDQVTIHELIHGFTSTAANTPTAANTTGTEVGAANTAGSVAGGLAAGRAFLVNDVQDANDQPDRIYFTDATQQPVTIALAATADKQSDTEYLLTVTPEEAGWTYGSLLDPTVGRQQLVGITRKSDGAAVSLDNVWQTDRTLIDGRDWLYEHRLHFVGEMPAEGETFVLTFAAKPDVELQVEQFVGVPKERTLATEQVKQIGVHFNKAIDAATFTTDDVTLACQGKQLDASRIVISKQTDTDYTLDISAITGADGYYVLTVQTATITDSEGFQGAAGRQATWIQYAGGKVSLAIAASPAEGGSVTPDSGQFDYGQTISLTATPAEGYDFARWTENGQPLTEADTYSYTVQGGTELTAVFTPKSYTVTIDYNAAGGTVEGGGSGLYTYGTQLSLTATPAAGWQFDGWLADGKQITDAAVLTYTVNQATTLQAVFTELPGAVLSGRVTRDTDGTPIGNATVTLQKGDVRYVTTTDSYGYYTLKVEDRSLTYDLVCQADGYMWSPSQQLWFDENRQTKNFTLLRGATVMLPQEGACTFSSPVALTLPGEPTRAWYLSKYDQQSFVVNEITAGSIAAGEGIILSGTAGQRIDMPEAASATAVMGNMLIGTPSTAYVVADDNVYVMHENASDVASFYLADKGELVGKGKAYCQFTLSGQPKTVSVLWSDADLIKAVLSGIGDPNAPHYDLQGRRIYHHDADMKGKKVHIVKGRKVVIK
ncbi:MAG: carboxypeptidase regulatory-like domain-containing protein, partial [Prevotella sp.]|nr:carboxypeptidase regulatory-like domain-containing protein [Prevotella sp.]